jgi:hypothetical protein
LLRFFSFFFLDAHLLVVPSCSLVSVVIALVVTFTIAANSPPPKLNSRIPVIPLISLSLQYSANDWNKIFASSIAVAFTFAIAIAYEDNRNSVFLFLLLLLLLLLLYIHSRLNSQDSFRLNQLQPRPKLDRGKEKERKKERDQADRRLPQAWHFSLYLSSLLTYIHTYLYTYLLAQTKLQVSPTNSTG